MKKSKTKIKVDDYKNRDEYKKEYGKQYREKNREYYREYYHNNKEKAKENLIARLLKNHFNINDHKEEIKQLEDQLAELRAKNKELLQKITKELIEKSK